MLTATTGLFRELHELYRLMYRVYLAGDELRVIARDHPLLRYLRDLDTASVGYEFLREFAGYDGVDPPLSIVYRALLGYHEALIRTIAKDPKEKTHLSD